MTGSVPMEEDEFWRIVESSRRRFDPARVDGNVSLQLEDLAEDLRELPPERTFAFALQFIERMDAAYRRDLWDAAYFIEDYCSDDCFMDFRHWLISMGRSVYENALADPDSLAEPAFAPGVECIFVEENGYVVALDVFEALTGNEFPEINRVHPKLDNGRFKRDRDELGQTYPRIAAARRERGQNERP